MSGDAVWSAGGRVQERHGAARGAASLSKGVRGRTMPRRATEAGRAGRVGPIEGTGDPVGRVTVWAARAGAGRRRCRWVSDVRRCRDGRPGAVPQAGRTRQGLRLGTERVRGAPRIEVRRICANSAGAEALYRSGGRERNIISNRAWDTRTSGGGTTSPPLVVRVSPHRRADKWPDTTIFTLLLSH